MTVFTVGDGRSLAGAPAALTTPAHRMTRSCHPVVACSVVEK
jgi:hypothetical protein